MSNSVEDRVVSMKFDNSGFLRGVRSTLDMLGRLKGALNLGGATKGMAQLQSSANKLDMSAPINGVSRLSAGFVAMSTVAITALANLTNKAVDAGLRIGKSLAIEPVMDGFREYELKMGSIQTILANTSRKGTTLDEVTHELEVLNEYADQTIYNFGAMTKNIGLFTNAGIGVKAATSMIKGFSNEAAASGTSAEGAASAAYQLSQALSTGTVRLMDWKSLSNVGMGNKNMQLSLIEMADAMGTLEKAEISAKDVQSDFNGSLETGWLSADVMSVYLRTMAGDYSKAKLAALGLGKESIKTLMAQQKMSEEAATKVRTLTQLMGTIKESVGSSWAESFDLIFGDFTEATDLFTGVNNSLGAFIGKSGEARNKLISDWAALGGRTAIIDTIKESWEALGSVLAPIRDGFRDIFPPTTGKQLAEMSAALRDFAAGLELSSSTAGKVRRIFAGIFSIFSTGWEIVKRLGDVIADVFGVAADGSGGLLEMAAALGDWLVAINEAVKSGDALDVIFDAISAGAQTAVRGLVSLMRDGVDALASVDWAGMLSGISAGFTRAFDNITWDGVLAALNTGLLGAIALLLKNFFDSALDFEFAGGVIDDIKNAFGEVEAAMVSIQTNLRAATLQKIAIAVGLLAGSIFLLATINPQALTAAMSAIVVSFGLLMGAMAIMTKIAGTKGFLAIPFVAASLGILAGAIVVLSVAAKLLASMSWEELARGLSGVAVLLWAITTAAKPLSAAAPGMIRVGVAMVPLAVGLLLLTKAVEKMSDLSWAEMGKGLAGLAGALAIIAGAMWLMPSSMVVTAAGILVLSFAIERIGESLAQMGSLSWDAIGKGLASLAGALLIIAGAMWLMPPYLPVIAAGLLLVSHAVERIGNSLAQMGGMSWEEIGKGLAAIGGALLILAGGLYLMSATLPGAAALVVAAAGINMLIPAIEALGGMTWGEIIKSLVALAGIFVVIGVAGLALAPIAVVMLAFGAALLLIGAALALSGAGMLAFAAALALMAKAGKASIDLVIDAFGAFADFIPQAVSSFVRGVVAMVIELGKSAPKMIGGMVKIGVALLDAVIRLAPKMGKAFTTVIRTGLRVIDSLSGQFIAVGIRLVTRLLNGIADGMPGLTQAGGNLIIAFIRGMSVQHGRISDAGAKAVITMVNGVAAAINNNAGALRAAGFNLAVAIIDGMTGGLASGVGRVAQMAGSVAKGALNAAKGVLGINSPSKEFYKIGKFVNEGFAKGLVGGLGETRAALAQMHDVFKNAIDRSNQIIDREKDRLERLRKDGKKDTKQYREAEKALRKANRLKKASTEANKALTESEKKHNKELFKLARQMDANTKKLDKAYDKLAAAKQLRDEFNEGTKDTFDDLPDVEQGQTYEVYEQQIRQAITANDKFNKSLDKLRSLGLSDQSYKKLLEEGVDAQALADSLASGGKNAVTEFNNLNKQLDNSAKALANDASKRMYQAGVDTAQGIVDGLKKNEKKIEAQMRRIAKMMVKAIKKELGIKSPSREMIEVAKFVTKGLTKGLDQYGKEVDKSAAHLGDRVISNVRTALSKIPDTIADNAELNPTIVPVIDLTRLAHDASRISSILDPGVVNLDGAYNAGQAMARSAASVLRHGEDDVPPGGTVVKFTQTNYSPKALSPIEIYRNTNNQLAIAKEALR